MFYPNALPGMGDEPTREREHRGEIYFVSEAHSEADRWPWLSDDELQELADSIGEKGQEEPIHRLPDGRIVDGRNRELACLIAGVEPVYTFFTRAEAEIRGFVRRKNGLRRHLSRERVRELIADALRENPDLSNRAHAAELKVSHNTVKAVRDELESCGQLDHTEKRTDSTGRMQSASKTAKKPKVTALAEPAVSPAESVQLVSSAPVPVPPVEPPHPFDALANKVTQLTAEITSALRGDDDAAKNLCHYFGIAGAIGWKRAGQGDEEAVADAGTGGDWVPCFMQLRGFVYLIKLATEKRRENRRTVAYQFGVKSGGILSPYAKRRAADRMRQRGGDKK